MLYCLKCDHVLRREDALKTIGSEILNRFFPSYLDRRAVPAVSICAIAHEVGIACPNCGAKAAWTEHSRPMEAATAPDLARAS